MKKVIIAMSFMSLSMIALAQAPSLGGGQGFGADGGNFAARRQKIKNRIQQAEQNMVSFAPAATFGSGFQGQYNAKKGRATIFQKPSGSSSGTRQRPQVKIFENVQAVAASAQAPAAPAVLIGSYTPANGSAMNLYGTPAQRPNFQGAGQR